MGSKPIVVVGMALALLLPPRLFADGALASDEVPAASVAVERPMKILDELAKTTAAERADLEVVQVRARMRTAVSRQIEETWAAMLKQKAKSKGQLQQALKLIALRQELVAWSDAGRSQAATSARQAADDVVKVFGKKKVPAFVTLVQASYPDLWIPEKSAAVVKTLEQLIAKNPEGGTTGDAHAMLGDFLNATSGFAAARSHYLSAQGYSGMARRDGVALRLAWCNFRAGQKAEALAGLKSVLKASSLSKTEALRSLAFFYAEAGDVPGGTAALKANGGGKFVGDLKFRTAALASRSKAASGKALALFGEYLKENPDGDLAANAKLAATALLFRSGDYAKLDASLQELHKTFGADGAWQKIRREQGKSGAKVSEQIKDLTLAVADDLFLIASSTANKEAAAKAISAYRLYLGEKSLMKEETARSHWASATLARRNGDRIKAGSHYDALVEMGAGTSFKDQKTKVDVPVHERSARWAVAMYETPPQQAYVDACRRFSTHYPKQTAAIKTCDLRTAEVHLALKQNDKAKEALTVVAKKYAKDVDGPAAVAKLFKLVAKDSPEQLTRARDLLAVEAYRSGPVGVVLGDLAFQADLAGTRKLADGLARADGFARLARDNPRQSLAPSLWIDVATEARAIGRPLKAVEAYRTLVAAYPAAGVTEGASFALAELLEQLFDLDGAEAAYSNYLERHPAAGSRSLQAQERLCKLRVALETATALAACEEFGVKDPKTAKTYVERLIARADRDGRVDYLRTLVESHYLNRYSLSANEQIEASYRVYAAYKRAGAEAQRAEARIQKVFETGPMQVTGDAKRIVAELKYRGALVTKTVCDQMTLEGGKASVDEMVKTIAAKQKALDNLTYNFSRIIDLGDPAWSAACQYQLGAAYEAFGAMLANPPAITGIAAVDVAAKLRDQAAVIKGEAKRFYKLSLETMHRNEVFNEIGARSIDGIARLDGKAFRFDDWIEAPAYFGSEVPVAVAKNLKGSLR